MTTAVRTVEEDNVTVEVEGGEAVGDEVAGDVVAGDVVVVVVAAVVIVTQGGIIGFKLCNNG